MNLRSFYRKYAPEFVKELRRSYKIKRQNMDHGRYQRWIAENEKEVFDLYLDREPLISVIVPVYDVKHKYLRECLDSVINGYYKNYELCIADDASRDEGVRDILREYEKKDRVKVVYRNENGHISRATNSALELAQGEFAAFMDCDDTLSPDALFRVAEKLCRNKKLDLIYSDEDKIDDKGNRSEPHFKPDYSPDSLMSCMYISHLGVYRLSIIKELGGLRVGFEGAQDYDLALRFTEKIPEDHIAHISKVLYHWRRNRGSTSGDTEAKDYVKEAAKKATLEAMARRDLPGDVEFIPYLNQYRPVYIPKKTKLSIIIPSKDNPELFERCVRSIRLAGNAAGKLSIDITVVDNGSSDEGREKYEKLCSELSVKYIYYPEKFNFSAMCNRGADNSEGELLLFLNDDTELIKADSFYRMAGAACLPKVGAVGAKLLYKDGKSIQHIGVVNIAPGPSHAFLEQKDDPDRPLRYARNIADFNYLAVTGAALMIERDKFERAGRFDESFPIGYNDVELCMRLEKLGLHSVVRTDAVLIHYESMSRGDDRSDNVKLSRLREELRRLYEKHPEYNGRDPYYNKNLDQNNVNFV